MEFLLILALFLILMFIGAPIGTSLGVSAVATIMYFDLGAEMLGVNFASGIASFPLLAIPFSTGISLTMEKCKCFFSSSGIAKRRKTASTCFLVLGFNTSRFPRPSAIVIRE